MFSLDVYPEVWVAGSYDGCIFSFSMGSLHTVLWSLYQFTCPPISVQGFSVLYIFANTCYYVFDNSHSNRNEDLIVVLNCISLLLSDLNHLFT